MTSKQQLQHAPGPAVLAFFNQKGGCGKTTSAVHLAGALAAEGERVLLVDLDPQAHATMALGLAPEEGLTMAEVLLGETPASSAVLMAPLGIQVLPSAARLVEFEEASGRMLHAEQRLTEALSPLQSEYDWILLDCPPRADGILCSNALFCCTQAILVVETGAFALQGALQALRILEETAERQGRGYDVRVLATLFDRRLRLARELLIALHARFGPALFDTVIRTSVRLREAPALGLPVHVLDPASRAATDFLALAHELLLARSPSSKAASMPVEAH